MMTPDDAMKQALRQPTQSDVEQVARALAQADGIEICSDATYALSSYGHKAQAALAAMRQPTQSDALKAAASALLADVRRRHPNEGLRCKYMIALDAALQEQSK